MSVEGSCMRSSLDCCCGPFSKSAGNRRTRQIPVPAHLKQEVEEGVHRYAEIQKWLKRISSLSLDLLEERKKR
jgi:hypothetical protein